VENLDQNDWIKLTKIMKIISKLPFFIDDTSDLSIHELLNQKLKTIIFEQNKIGLIIIDYLQLMQNSNLITENRVQELITNYSIIKNYCTRI
jgi:replicative DNA helicase